MVVGGVVRDDVDDHLDSEAAGFGDHRVEVLQRAQPGIDVAVVGHVVSAVGQGRGVEGAQPDGVDPQLGEVRNP
jgi:hypothetical protein